MLNDYLTLQAEPNDTNAIIRFLSPKVDGQDVLKFAAAYGFRNIQVSTILKKVFIVSQAWDKKEI